MFEKDVKVESGWRIFCEGCGYSHYFRTWILPNRPPPPGKPKWPMWTFDGNTEKPTFAPSLKYSSGPGKYEDGKWVPTGPEKTTCHIVVLKGQITYCGDCAHALKGQTRPMLDIPE